MSLERKVVLVTRRTRLEELLDRFHTVEQARFYVEHLGADFGDYESEHRAYRAAHTLVSDTLLTHGRVQRIDRKYLPTFQFGSDDVVIALGQDGLVANTMKYLTGHPLIGINPDPTRFDGVLLPFAPEDLEELLPEVLTDHCTSAVVTMAEATLPDGQVMRAVNDLFIGPRSHTSARYELQWNGRTERQSSSGLIVSTGLGSTGWLASIVAGSAGIVRAWEHSAHALDYAPMDWDSPTLRFAVREPFPSRTTGTELVFGEVDAKHPLTLRSMMVDGGVLFSDGLEDDRIRIDAGMTVTVAPSRIKGRLVR